MKVTCTMNLFTTGLPRITALVAVVALGAALGPAVSHAESAARAHGELCQNQSKQRVAGQSGTPFGRCVTAMGRLAAARTSSPRRACASLNRGTPYRRCVTAGTRLLRVGNGIDRAFVADMASHHQAAIEMANLATVRGESEFVHMLAGDIVRSRQAEIATMSAITSELERLGVKARGLGLSRAAKGMDQDISQLVAAEPFDPAFLAMTIRHHQGALNTARAELRRGTGLQTRRLAYAILAVSEREIELIKEHRAGVSPSVETIECFTC